MELPKGKLFTLEAGQLGSRAAALPVLPDKVPASEFVIFKAGVNDSDYGPVTFDEIATAYVMQAFAEKGLAELPFDYNHGMARDEDDPKPTAEQGKAAGYFTPIVRDGALVASKCRWTEEAYGRIQKGEYSLFSPWFQTLTTDDGVMRPCKLFNVAILNCAGLNWIEQIAAGSATKHQENVMSEAEIKALQDRNRQLETENATLRASVQEVTVLTGALQLGASAGAVDRAEAIRGVMQLRSDVRKVTGKDTDAGALGVIEGWREKAGQADQLIAEREKAINDSLTLELGTLLDGAIKDGKITPGEREIYETAALAKGGGKPSKEGIAFMRAKVETMGKKVSTTEVGQKKPGAPEITETSKVVAVQMGVNIEDYELFLTDRKAWEEKLKTKGRQPAAATR